MRGDLSSASLEKIFEMLGSSENGLTSFEAKNRLEKFGANEIAAKDRRGVSSIFLSQFKSPLILILIFASIIAGFLGELIDAIIIICIVFLNAILGFYQEFKSERALAELKRYISFSTTVFRDNKKVDVNVRELVPGDIVFLNIGDIVPADIRLIDSHDITVNEAVVTGESFPVYKTGSVLKKASSSKQENIVFMGTSISGGSGKGIVISTGKKTKFGKTVVVLSAKEPPTDFQKNIKKFGKFLLKVIFLLTIFVFILNAILGKGILASFLFALALAVGITPELLPIIITISLSMGAINLAKKNVVVKRLVAIEDLGNVDVLCVDKTGTLTENKVVLEDYFDINGNKPSQLLEFALLCNSESSEDALVKGNIIDAAIWNYANKKNRISTEHYKKLEEIDFDYQRRRMSVIVKKHNKRILICKGAPESILEQCNSIQKQNKIISIKNYEESLKEKFGKLGQQGFRVISIAFKEIETKGSYSKKDENRMVFFGFLVFSDPPKRAVTSSLNKLQRLGVELKILTGDNEFVTQKICQEIKLKIKGKIILGSELEKMNEAELFETIEKNNVFVRITPEQKFKIVKGLNNKGHIVGFLGDGINDAPALKAADVGITVDSAVDIAKDSADIILLKKSLGVLAEGVKGGRKTFGNITKYIFNTVSANFGNMFTLAFSSLFLKFIPLLPSQILLANFISDGPLMTVPTDNVDESYLHKPKRWNIKTISNFMMFFGAISSIFDFITICLLFFVVKADIAMLRTAWFLESVLSEIIITFSIRTKKRFWQSKPSKLLVWSSALAVVITIGLIYSPLAFLFGFDKIAIPILIGIGTILFAYFFLSEIAKKKFYKKHEA